MVGRGGASEKGVFRQVKTAFVPPTHFDFAMVDAARTLGCSYPRALVKVLVPNLAPAFLSGGLFAFIISFDNYAV